MAGNSVVCCPIWPKFEYTQGIMYFLLICKCKKDQINSNREKVETLIFVCSRATYSIVIIESVINSTKSKLLWLSLLPGRMKKIHSKMKALEWSQHFSHCKSIRIFPHSQGQLAPLSGVKLVEIRTHSSCFYNSPGYLLTCT